jgi:small-conductance mechanosensitive channel
LSGLFGALVVLALTWLAGRLIREATRRLADSFANQRLTIEQLSAFLRFGVYVGGVLLAVSSVFSLSPEVLTVLGGTIVVTTGFALKDQASSIIAGLVILVEKPFQVGDRVTFGGHYGEITSIGLRSVRLVTLDDNEVTIPNSKFLTESVASGNAGALTMLVQQDFHVALDEDPRRAVALVGESVTTSPYFCPDHPWTVLVEETVVGELLALRVRAKAYVTDLRYEKAFASDVCQRVLDAFREAGVRRPTHPRWAGAQGP